MNEVRFRSYLFLFALTILLTGIVIADRISPSGRNIVKIQGIDPTCYFGVAHSLLFDHDFNLTDELQVFPPAPSKWTLRQPATGLPGSPYAIGYSLLEIPFLAVGTGIDFLTHHPANGYSRYALLLYFFANMAFSLAGVFLLIELLIRVFGPTGRSGQIILYFCVAATFGGSSLLVYSFSPMAHAATFLFATGFLLVWYRLKDSYSLPGWMLFGIVAGFLAITRWQDGLFLAGPALFDLFHLKNHIRSSGAWLKSRLLFLFVFCLCWTPQFFEWKVIYGRYLTVPQGDGFLHWPPAYFFHVLFSTSHGWFTWTPVTMIGFAGLICAACKSKALFVPWLVVVLAEIAVMGAMPTNWDGSDSFSIRSLTSCLPIVAMGLAALLLWPRRWIRITSVALVCISVLDAMLFAAQYRLDMIPRKQGLTTAELITDKLFFARALRRRAVHERATQLIAAGHPEQAAALARQAIDRYRENRFLLGDLEKASLDSGDPAAATAAHDRLQQLLDRRLF